MASSHQPAPQNTAHNMNSLNAQFTNFTYLILCSVTLTTELAAWSNQRVEDKFAVLMMLKLTKEPEVLCTHKAALMGRVLHY